MIYSKPFSLLSKNNAPIAGGKGASLGEMTRAGIPVPPGFVILAGTFDEFLEIAEIDADIDSIISKVNHQEIHTVEQASKEIQAIILSATMPKEIETEIKSEFKKLKTKYVAVRSSATAEDSSAAAWAGQLDSFLNTNENNLLENVKKCWASLFTPRAIFYRFERQLHNQKISVAVVVQKMVESEVSGIAFSVHPVTEDHNQIIIEAGFGLGEAIVSGQITPDSYVVIKNDLKILDKNIYTQARGIYRSGDNKANEWLNIPNQKGSSPCLSDQQILELSELIIRIENHYGFPCDIEWAMAGDKFYIVQSRPITTLKNRSISDNNKDSSVVLSKWCSREYSLLQIVQYCQLILENKEKTGYCMYYELFFYNSKIRMVEVYHLLPELDGLFKGIGDLARDPMFVREVIADFKQSLNELIPYFEGHKKTKNISEFRKLYDLFFKFSRGDAYVWVLPLLNFLPEADRKMAMACREATEKYSSDRDAVLVNNLKILFPFLGDLVRFLLPEEVFGSKIDNALKEKLEKRSLGFVYYRNQLHQSSEVRDFFHNHGLEIEKYYTGNNPDEIKGVVAQKGVARGRVKLVFVAADLSKVEKGDIIISPMTRPEFLPTMKLALAFVTDEGGITCHAAIVAREMGKPCIIGTKIATQILKDGDLVEVDADTGTVRIIKNNQEILNVFNQSINDYQIQPEGGRGVFYFLDHIIINQYTIENKDWPLADVNVFSSSTNHNAKWFRLHKDQSQYKEALDKFINKPELVDELLIYLNSNREHVTKILNEKNYSELSDQELIDFFDYILDCYYKVFRPSVIIRLVDLGLITKLKEIFLNKKDSDNCLAISSASEHKSFVLDEKISLLTLAIEIKNKNLEITNKHVLNKLTNIFNEYCFSELGYYNEKIKTIDEYKQRLLDIIKLSPKEELSRIENDFDRVLKQRKKILSELSADEKKIVNIASKLTHVKDIYKLAINEVLYSSEKLFFEIAKRVDRSVDYIKDLSPTEIKSLLNKKDIDETLIQERLSNRVIISFKKKFYVLTGEEASRFKAKYLEIEKNSNTFFGRCASSGHVFGKVRIILGPEDFYKMAQAEILVVMNTSPDFTPILKSAKAIIAEEGGLTAHVSIVSRELGIPSVVGVHHITEILKDGDEVEVDANNGVVKIIKPSK